jgi:hypothetical protein
MYLLTEKIAVWQVFLRCVKSRSKRTPCAALRRFRCDHGFPKRGCFEKAVTSLNKPQVFTRY